MDRLSGTVFSFGGMFSEVVHLWFTRRPINQFLRTEVDRAAKARSRGFACTSPKPLASANTGSLTCSSQTSSVRSCKPSGKGNPVALRAEAKPIFKAGSSFLDISERADAIHGAFIHLGGFEGLVWNRCGP